MRKVEERIDAKNSQPCSARINNPTISGATVGSFTSIRVASVETIWLPCSSLVVNTLTFDSRDPIEMHSSFCRFATPLQFRHKNPLSMCDIAFTTKQAISTCHPELTQLTFLTQGGHSGLFPVES